MTACAKRIFFSIIVVGLGAATLYYQKSHSISALNFKKYEERGNQLFQESKIEEAINCWQKSLLFAPSPEKIYNKIGIAYLAKSDYENGIKSFQKGLKINPKDVTLSYNLGLCFFQLGNDQMALNNLDDIETLNPYYPDVHCLKGAIYERAGLKKEAKAEYIKEVNINPGSIRAWSKLQPQMDADERRLKNEPQVKAQ